jgi:hypothetical protein
LIMTGRKVDAEECLRIGLCERLAPRGEARRAADDMAREIARFPQASLRADRRSVYLQYGLSERAALERDGPIAAASSRRKAPPAPRGSPMAPGGTAISGTSRNRKRSRARQCHDGLAAMAWPLREGAGRASISKNRTMLPGRPE